MLGTYKGQVLAVAIDRGSLKLIEQITGVTPFTWEHPPEVSHFDIEDEVAAIFVGIEPEEASRFLDFLPEVRRRWPFRPLLVITRQNEEEVLSSALGMGADDVLYRPLSHKELIARLQARIQDQAAKEAKHFIRFGNMNFNNKYRALSGDKGQVYLSATESNLLLSLVEAKGTIVDRSTLKQRCWGSLSVSDGALDRKIYEVRRALEEVGGNGLIRTVYGLGFGLDLSNSSLPLVSNTEIPKNGSVA